MSITAATTQNPLTLNQRMTWRQTPDERFFTAYVQAFAGYAAAAENTAASATDAAAAAPVAERLLAVADLLGEVHTALSARRGVGSADQAAYAEILNRAYAGGGMADPAGFLASLTPAELAVVQRNHCLAERIDPARLSREGACNLLLPEGWRVDLDKNDLVEVGAARLVQFPPLDAPAEFLDAWRVATQDMNEMDISTYGLKMFIGMHTLGEQPLRRMPAEAMASYRQLVAAFLDMLEHFRSQLSAEQYARDQAFFGRLQALLG
ncbi:conserved protein of unknown function [Sterolibacterium denitrificans]|uniref:Uncharacterized protein n=1 Tax=Sterolibacterium denitrificans TaxID=157592 RepID=A0A7Z7MUE8_9PROT|nr:hypothetical protein [Sterolibacterium denitrificans]SMB22753.1 conserved protein of unknown function [Sterolibacterium denitrificans]